MDNSLHVAGAQGKRHVLVKVSVQQEHLKTRKGLGGCKSCIDDDSALLLPKNSPAVSRVLPKDRATTKRSFDKSGTNRDEWRPGSPTSGKPAASVLTHTCSSAPESSREIGKRPGALPHGQKGTTAPTAASTPRREWRSHPSWRGRQRHCTRCGPAVAPEKLPARWGRHGHFTHSADTSAESHPNLSPDRGVEVSHGSATAACRRSKCESRPLFPFGGRSK